MKEEQEWFRLKKGKRQVMRIRKNINYKITK